MQLAEGEDEVQADLVFVLVDGRKLPAANIVQCQNHRATNT